MSSPTLRAYARHVLALWLWCRVVAATAEWTQETAVDWRGRLLATKLHIPRTPLGFVSRPRLVARLEEGLTRGFVLVSAPAGFGKTALLADWSQRRQRAVAWLSLDSGDNDPVRFWRHAVAALDRLQPGLADQVGPLLARPQSTTVEGVVSAVINELANTQAEASLVLDDYHVIEANDVHTSLMVLIEHPPPGLHLVLASRSDPPLSLGGLRGRGRLAELRAAELRFTSAEAVAMLRGAVGPALDDDAVDTLVARSEGWVAGLQLAALSLRGRADASAFVSSFSGTHRYVLDYLTEEVLEGQPEAVRTFLLETSVLERLSGPQCDAITGRSDSQEILEMIERANLFLVPLDEVRAWWRYHHLFADLLRSRLEQQRPHRIQGLHRNAANWAEQQGLADDAVRHALASGDPVWAAQLIERHTDALILRGEGATAHRWLAALPAELVSTRPRLLLARALLALFSGRLEGVEAMLENAERFADTASEPYEPSVGRADSALANVPAAIALYRGHLAELRGDAERAIAFGQEALVKLGADESMLGSIGTAWLAIAHWLGGHLEAAERGLAEIVEGWKEAGQRYLAIRASYYLGLVDRAEGNLDGAVTTYQRALEIAAPPGRSPFHAAGPAYVGLAEVAYQRNELDTARQYVTEGIRLCRQFAYALHLPRGLATLAWIHHATGDATGALDAMREAERVAPSSDLADLLNPVPAQRAQLLLRQGDLAAAVQWVGERGLTADDEVSYPREPAFLVLARVLIATDAADRALGLLSRLRADAAAHGRTGSLIEIHALEAHALATMGKKAKAVEVLADALVLAGTQRYVRVFVDEGPTMATLVGGLIATRKDEHSTAGRLPTRYLTVLARAFDADASCRNAPGALTGTVVSGLVTALSDRELEVLKLLAEGKQNREIADELYVTRDTVKKHVTHILDKLGASNRTQATVRAHELGLLE